jgi:hypothetical protein
VAADGFVGLGTGAAFFKAPEGVENRNLFFGQCVETRGLFVVC